MHPNRNRKPEKNASCIFSAFLSLVTNLSDFVPGLEAASDKKMSYSFKRKSWVGRKPPGVEIINKSL